MSKSCYKEDIDTSSWKFLGKSPSEYELYEVEPNIYAFIPPKDSKQTEAAATSALAFINGILSKRGQKGGTIGFIDPIISMDYGARQVLSQGNSGTHYALVVFGGTALGRAIGTFLMGINKVAIPVKMTSSMEEAIAWLREMDQKHGGPIDNVPK